MYRCSKQEQTGFTIVELLIVIVVIGILAAITVVAYNGVQARANDVHRESDIENVVKLVQNYYAINGAYPSTGGLNVAYADSNCTNSNPNKRTDWVPSLGVNLPQSFGPHSAGYGCYIYASDGQQFIISAWLAVQTGPQTTTMYHRYGFRETNFSSNDFYYCNTDPSLTTYWDALYKYSYTISNIPPC
jgi:prepilin-type N-terminal cleavage/methylation domain-containing protein